MTRASAVRMCVVERAAVGLAVAVIGLSSAAARSPAAALSATAALPRVAAARAAPTPVTPGAAAAPAVRCLPDGTGYFRAQVRWAIDANIDWRNAALECEGGMRPDGHGIRVSFAGPARYGGATHPLRFIFGIAAAGEGRSGRAVPANVTLIVEGERHIYSTRGDDKCTIDDLRQSPIGRDAHHRSYRVSARGFCVEPATRLGGHAAGRERVLVSRFDFVGRISLYTDDRPAATGADDTTAHIGHRHLGRSLS